MDETADLRLFKVGRSKQHIILVVKELQMLSVDLLEPFQCQCLCLCNPLLLYLLLLNL